MKANKNFKIFHASAGSGKTYTLALYYILLALKGDQYGFEDYYKKILAITFTNKASKEMKERILYYLESIALERNEDNVIDWIQNHSELSKDEIYSRAKKIHKHILHNYTDFSVSTIDKFTYRLIRTFARDLGISHNFELEMDNYKIVQPVISTLLSNISEKRGDLSRSLVEFALQKTSEGKSSNIEEDLENFSKHLFKESASTYIINQDLSIKECMQVKKELQLETSKLTSKLKGLSVEAINYFNDNNLDRESFIKRPSIYDYLTSNIIDLNDNKWIPSSTLHKNVFNHNWYPKSKEKILAPLVDPCIKEIISFYERSLLIIKDYTSKKAVLKNIYSISIISELVSEIKKYKKDQNVEQISAFNQLVHNIIVKQPSTFIYERLGERYNHFLLDEFQDTSVLQWQNLLPLIVDSLDSGTSLIVGDPKQSIYRWRSGEMHQFVNLPTIYKGNHLSFKQEWENKLTNHYQKNVLHHNFRSSREIITFNNLFFSKVKEILPSSLKEVYDSHSQTIDHAKEGGYVCVEQFSNNQFKESVCHRIVEEIHHLINKRNYRFSDIAILCNSNKNTSFVAEQLMKSNINVVSNEGILLSSSEKVHFIISVLKHLSNPSADIPRVSMMNYLNNNLFSVDSHELSLLSKSNDNFYAFLKNNNIHFNVKLLLELPIYQLVEHLVIDFKIPNDLYIHFLKDSILKYELKEGSSISKFLIWWEEARKKETIIIPEETNAVNIMTVHKAKGLAFNVVIIPFNWDDGKKTDEIWVDTTSYLKNSLSAALINTNQRLKLSHFSNEYTQEQEFKLLDNLNKLYVAMTRAKERLYIFTKEYPKTINNDFLKKGYLNSFLHAFGCNKSLYVGKEEQQCQSLKHSNLKPFMMRDIEKNTFKDIISLKSAANELWETTENNNKKDWGKLLHLALSSIYEISDIDAAVHALFINGRCNLNDQERLQESIKKLLFNPLISSYFKPGLNIKTEQEIILPNGKTYIPDRLIFDKDEVIIIDYKSGKKRKKDQEQINIYADTLHLMGYKVKEKKIIYLEDYIV